CECLRGLGATPDSVVDMTVTVLVPDEAGMTALGEVDGVRPVRYDPQQDLPAEAAHAEVLVPGFLRAEDSEFFAALPELRLVQLLTAGAENWVGRLPQGVLLSTCRGAHGDSSPVWAVAAALSVYLAIE